MTLDSANLAETERLMQGYKSMKCYQDFITYNTKLSLAYRNGSVQKPFQIGNSEHVIYVTSAACNSSDE